MSCRDYDHYIQLYVDQEISEADRKKLLSHVRMCDRCRKELTEMVALVSSFEDIRQDYVPKIPTFNRFFKWVTVCTVIVSFVYLSPWESFVREKRDSTPPMESSVIVLAAQEESLHIPSDMSIQVIHPEKPPQERFNSETTLVYPSALSYFLDHIDECDSRGAQYVFVRVPDKQTLLHLLTHTGGIKENFSDVANVQFPTSVKVFTRESKYETFTFPETKQDIVDWFQSFERTTMASPSH